MNKNIITLIVLGVAVIITEIFSIKAFSLANILDILLIAVGIAIVHFGKVIGGALGSEMKWVFFGFVLLVFAHALETILFSTRLITSLDVAEATHRVLVLAGFILIMIGFYNINKSAQNI